jgi:hypothetical protein
MSAEDGHVKWSHDLPTDSFQRYDLLSAQQGLISLIANDRLIRLTENGTVTTIFDLSPYRWDEASLDGSATSLKLHIWKQGSRGWGDLLFFDLATSNIIARCSNTSVLQTISKSSVIDYNLDKDDTRQPKTIYRSSFCGEPSPVGLTSDAWAGAYAIDGTRYAVVGKGTMEVWEDGGHEITHLAFPRTKTALRWGQISPDAKLAAFTVTFGNFPEEFTDRTREKDTAQTAYIISLENAERKATIPLPVHSCGFPEYAFSRDGSKLALLCDNSWDLKVFDLRGLQ